MRRSHALWLAPVLTIALAGAPRAQPLCPLDADARVEAAWQLYRADVIEDARRLFAAVVAACPGHVGSRTGLGYAELRLGRLDEAGEWFRAVLAAQRDVIDAWLGLGLVAWRQGDHPAARDAFQRVLALEPGHGDAARFLERVPPADRPPTRPPLVLPPETAYPARVQGDRFEVRTPSGWAPFYVKGANLGAALPGRYPSEFPDSATYTRWIAAMAELGANTVRVYTIHPPHFYRALLRHNLAHPDAPLWLVQGVWAELPPDDNFDDPAWNAELLGELQRAVDLIHGRADIAPRPGHASGHYTADVSLWTLAFLVGREWEPHSVAAYHERRPGRHTWSGRYLEMRDGTATDAWLARICDALVAYEMSTYRWQRPVAYTNWPTLDPLHHPTESTAEEEVRLRRALGEPGASASAEYDNDRVSLDAMLVRGTDAFPAGYFAAYHIYPYYPDFMVLDPGYAAAVSPEGPSAYFGYLVALKAHHRGMPLLVAEYGVPASLGAAHLHPQGWHHGGHSEELMATLDAQMTREIAAAGMAGGLVFAWIDEWFKKSWLYADFLLPLDRNRLWLNRLDPEQQYGLLALEPVAPVPGASLAERLPGWQQVEPLYTNAAGARLRALADEAQLWLLFEPGAVGYEELLIGFDIVQPDGGSFRWPGRAGPPLPAGVEFVLRAARSEVRLLADPASNPFRFEPIPVAAWAEPRLRTMVLDGSPPGVFAGRLVWDIAAPFVTRPRDDGRFDSLRVITNRRRVGRDFTEFAALGYDRGVLLRGPTPDGSWETLGEAGPLEIRIPWALLNVTDPSSRRVLQHRVPAAATTAGLSVEQATQVVDAIGVVAASRDAAGRWRAWPASGAASDVARFSWATWEEPRWRERRRPTFTVLRETFATLDPFAPRGDTSP